MGLFIQQQLKQLESRQLSTPRRPPRNGAGMWALQRLHHSVWLPDNEGSGKMCVGLKLDGFQFSRTKNPAFGQCSPLTPAAENFHSLEGLINAPQIIGHSLNSGCPLKV